MFPWHFTLFSVSKHSCQMLLHCPLKTQDAFVDIRVGFDPCPVEIQFFSPHSSCCNTVLDNVFKEPLKYSDPVAVTDTA